MTEDMKDTLESAAFPFTHYANSESVTATGMTLRDYFAAKAIAVVMPSVVEILQKQNLSQEKTDQLKKGAAAACYGMADAMLEARVMQWDN